MRRAGEGVRRLSLLIATVGGIGGLFAAMPLVRDLQQRRWSFQYFQQQRREHPSARVVRETAYYSQLFLVEARDGKLPPPEGFTEAGGREEPEKWRSLLGGSDADRVYFKAFPEDWASPPMWYEYALPLGVIFLGFTVPWAATRFVAWVVSGFVLDRNKNS
jgi:hypothetical protein